MRTTVDIDPHLLRRLRDEARRCAVPFNEFLATIIRRGLEKRAGGARRPYRAPSFSMGDPAPEYDLDKALAFADGLEDEAMLRKLRQPRRRQSAPPR